MDPDRCKPVFRHFIDLLKLIEDARKVRLSQILNSRKVRLFFLALLVGELAGILASVHTLRLVQNNFCGGWPAVESAIVASYKSEGLAFYSIWLAIRWVCGQWKMFAGDVGIFAGPGTLYDWVAGGLHGLLGFIIFFVTGSEASAVILSTIIQAVLYLFLTTRLFGALLVVRG